MYICVHVHVHVHVHAHVRTVHVHVHAYVHAHEHVHVKVLADQPLLRRAEQDQSAQTAATADHAGVADEAKGGVGQAASPALHEHVDPWRAVAEDPVRDVLQGPRDEDHNRHPAVSHKAKPNNNYRSPKENSQTQHIPSSSEQRSILRNLNMHGHENDIVMLVSMHGQLNIERCALLQRMC